jgi:uncharacterized protein (DUF2235 family)
MALYAFDGTGNEEKDALHDSNVFVFFQGYDDPQANDDAKQPRGSLYLKGIGTRVDDAPPVKLFAEAFGVGGLLRINDAMTRLQNNLDAGDNIIDIVGFSRGAALAVDFANRIAGKFKDASVRFLGVWDIVGDFGMPGMTLAHNLNLPPNAKTIRHGMAMDEHRIDFPLTRLAKEGQPFPDELQEVWFRGVHSDVGGGNDNMSLNWIALNWMFLNAQRAGVPLKANAIADNLARRVDPPVVGEKLEVGPPRQFRAGDLLHSSVPLGGGLNDPSISLARIDDAGNITAAATG